MANMKYKIGQKFMTRGKNPKFCQVVDILSTFNSAGELVKVSYVAKHAFMGQIITDTDVCETTIAMGIVGLEQYLHGAPDIKVIA